MKPKLSIVAGVLGAACLPLRAQLFNSESLGGAALGGLIGGIVGHNSGGHTAEGVGIGAGAGLLLGAFAHDARQSQTYYETQMPYPGEVAYSYPAPVYYGYSQPYYQPYRPNYAVTGAVLGGLAGGIIGHNSHGRTLEGIGIGAGAGLVLGGLAEEQARRYETAVPDPPSRVGYILPSYLPRVTSSGPALPADANAIPASPRVPPASLLPERGGNNGAGNPMSGANSLFGR